MPNCICLLQYMQSNHNTFHSNNGTFSHVFVTVDFEHGTLDVPGMILYFIIRYIS